MMPSRLNIPELPAARPNTMNTIAVPANAANSGRLSRWRDHDSRRTRSSTATDGVAEAGPAASCGSEGGSLLRWGWKGWATAIEALLYTPAGRGSAPIRGAFELRKGGTQMRCSEQGERTSAGQITATWPARPVHACRHDGGPIRRCVA